MGRADGIALPRLAEFLFRFLVDVIRHEEKVVAESLWRDWQRVGRRDPPEFLHEILPVAEKASGARRPRLPKRQARHLPMAGGTSHNR